MAAAAKKNKISNSANNSTNSVLPIADAAIIVTVNDYMDDMLRDVVVNRQSGCAQLDEDRNMVFDWDQIAILFA